MVYAEHSLYASLWNKYRPVILKLMSSAGEGPQEYKLYSHEFKALNPKEKTYTFTMEVTKGKAYGGVKTSTVARDLFNVLQQSKKASELMNENSFELRLDKHFVFHVSYKAEEVKEVKAAAALVVEAPVLEEATPA